MKKLIDKMLQEDTWAVIGASDKKDKYGYKIFKKLKKHNYNVYPVNPGYDEVAGERCFHSINDLPKKPDCISMVVNPKIALNILMAAKKNNITNIWFQPGSYNDELISKAQDLEFTVIFGECILVELRKREEKLG